MYDLSYQQKYHSRDMRCLDYYNGILVTGGSDKIFHMFNVKNGQLEKITSHDIFQKNILSLKINRKGGSIFVLVGIADGKIFAFDAAGSPVGCYQHNSPISSIDFIDSDHFVTGSWDGKGIVWQISTFKMLSSYDNHKHAVTVFYNSLNQSVISGSQDKALNCWNWKNGVLNKRVQSAHNDIIRQMSKVDEVGFITCSNDQTLKLWTTDLELVQTFHSHTSYVFAAKAKELGKYFSGGDDNSLKIWENQSCTQTIQFPASIWSITLGQNDDIYTACSDGFLRVFTLDETRKAQPHIIQAFNKQTLDASSKKSGMSPQQIQKLPNTTQMNAMMGKKEGQIRVFKNGNVPQAYMWQNSKWQKIGQVITEGGGQQGKSSQPKYYEGDKYFEAGEYDYLFDVDDDSGIRKTIPFNDGGNALQSAQKYCLREGISKGNIEQIRKFLMTNSSKIPRKAIKDQTKEINYDSMRTTPQVSIVEYGDIKNPSGLFKKINEFNQGIEAQKLNQKQLQHCQRIVTLLQNSKNYHSWKFDFKEMDTIKKLLTWPKEKKFPVWDLLRAFLLHYQSQAFFTGLSAGLDIITSLAVGLQFQHPQAIYTLIFKTLSNTMIQNSNKGGMIKHCGIVFNSVFNFSKRKELKNKNLLGAISAFIYNYSISFYQKKLQNEKVISDFSEIIKVRIQMDQDQQNRSLILQAAANILFKYRESKNQFQFLRKYLLGNQVSKDLDTLLG